LPSDDVFLLKVKGDSMTGRCISDGDFVLCSPSQRAKDGDIVAARIGDEATVKTLAHKGQTVVLEPANPAERPIEIGAHEDFAILGVVCGIFRPFFEQEPAREVEEMPSPATSQLH
jgi:repressor LexA